MMGVITNLILMMVLWIYTCQNASNYNTFKICKLHLGSPDAVGI